MVRQADVVALAVTMVFLAAVLGAVGSHGRKRAKEVVCAVNLRRWGKGFEVYAEDHGGYFMPGWVGHGWETDVSWVWYRALEPYVGGSERLRRCPEAVEPAEPWGSGVWPANAAWYVQDGSLGGVDMTGWGFTIGDSGSYGVNRYVYNPPPIRGMPRRRLYCNPDVQGRNWFNVYHAERSNVPVLADSSWIGTNPDESDSPWGDSEECNGMGTFLIDRHRGGVNVLFMDWSVRRVGLKGLWGLKWHRQWDTCNQWTVCGGIEPNDWPEWMQALED
jgi:prepilin-type processing-associated H-X9-DG protein